MTGHSLTISTHSPEETRILGRRIAEHAPRGVFIGLSGELGSGKTELVRGMAEAFGMASQVSSPSYVLENVYSIEETAIHHWDLYRVAEEEAESLDVYDQLGNPQKMIVVEWPERVSAINELVAIRILFKTPELREKQKERVLEITAEEGALLESLLQFEPG